jgi:type II secretion system protein C
MFTRFFLCFLTLFLAVPSLAFSQASVSGDEIAEVGITLILEGVIITSDPGASVALVRRPDARRARSVRVGETIYGMVLVEVSEEAAVFERDGKPRLVYLDGGGASTSPRVAEKTGSPGKSVGEGVDSQTSDNGGTEPETWLNRELPRRITEERLTKEMPVILAETGISPRTDEEESQGLQITHLPDGTLLSEIGLLPGDVLISVNDVPLTSMSALAGLLPQLRSESEIRVLLERRGQILGLAYHIH